MKEPIKILHFYFKVNNAKRQEKTKQIEKVTSWLIQRNNIDPKSVSVELLFAMSDDDFLYDRHSLRISLIGQQKQ